MRTDQQEFINQQAAIDYQAGDYEAAFKAWLSLAEAGDAEAQYNISAFYDDGTYVPQDKQKAYEWCLASLKSGYLPAMVTVGNKLINGTGVTKDVDKGIELLESAASEGSTSAMIGLASVYVRGNGKPQDYEKGAQWLTQAAERGDAVAQCTLANCYDNGLGVEESSELSTFWYVKAYENGNIYAKFPVGARLVSGNCLQQDIPKGISILKEAAANGIHQAMRKLGEVYCSDEFGVLDVVEGLNWYEAAAEHGCHDSEAKLGFLYTHGANLEHNLKRGIYWLERAVANGDDVSKTILATLLLRGAGCEKDVARAFRLLNEALEGGEEGAMFCLGKCYFQGIEVAPDKAKGLDLIKQAAAKEWPEAVEYLLWLELYGFEDIQASPETAIPKLKKLAEDGQGWAATLLVRYLSDNKIADEFEIRHWLKIGAEGNDESAAFQLGLLLIASGNPMEVAEGVRWLKAATIARDGYAEFNLARLYFDGEKVPKDYKEALHWAEIADAKGMVWGTHYKALILANEDFEGHDFKKAFEISTRLAATGLMNACALLGCLYEEGMGTEADLNLAVFWYEKAAEQGYLAAAHRLVRLLYYGDNGFPVNQAAAVRWMTLLADKGEVYWMALLAYIHGDGELVPENMVEAYKYLALGYPYADGPVLEVLSTLKPDFETQMSPGQLEESRRLAEELRAQPDFMPKLLST